tara:strand:+ start:626 stop:916 length:291 start_codon:yes stop_codon:yes gene_type:complete
MPQLSKAEKTAVKKVKAQASAKVEVKGMGGFPATATISATGKQPRAEHNQEWVSSFDGLTIGDFMAIKNSDKVLGGFQRDTSALRYMVKYGYITVG